MNILEPQVKSLVENKNYEELNALLANNPGLANEGMTIPYDFLCMTKAHPLHRLCDGVVAGKISEDEAIKLAKIFLDHGADIDGDKAKGEGTPLLAAASLHADQLGIFYIENGADIQYTYKNDGASALHWAAFCGRDELVDRLIRENAALNEPDSEHRSTPIAWALHALMINDSFNKHKQVDCIKLLLKAGIDITVLSQERKDYLRALGDNDPELKGLLA